MKLSTRVTLLATMLVAPMLGGLGYAALRARRADLESDLARQAREVADALRAGIEPLEGDTAAATLTERAWRARERDDTFQLEILKAPNREGRPWKTGDPGWLVLVDAAEYQDAPVGRMFERGAGTSPSFAMAIPLHDAAGLALPHRDPNRRPVAVLGMRRSTEYIDVAVAATARRMFPLLLAVVVFLALGVLLALRAGVTAPLRRLVEGVDGVGKGDLSRVLLVEREDDIGGLANRFNAMTASLREARAEADGGAEARLALETRLRQSEKLATIGQMAAEIAHEVGTPLNVIGGRARALQKKAGDVEEVTKNAEIIQTQVGRITKIINQVLDFSRKKGPTVTRVRLAAVVAEALDFVGEAIRRQGIVTEIHPDIVNDRRVVERRHGTPAYGVGVATPTPMITMGTLGGGPNPPTLGALVERPGREVPGDPDQIQQVCLNLLMNAVHAMPAGGRLRLWLDVVSRRKGGLDLAAPADYAMLEIVDTGPGISPDHRENIFEPFFTTKDEGQGTGLGLAVSHGIVKDHDGWIEVESPPAGAPTGTAFRVYLPLGTAPSGTASTVGTASELASGGQAPGVGLPRKA
jgi:signal transduction histidine kinase